VKDDNIKELTDPERERWVELNQTIKKGLDQMLTEVGPALAEIRDSRLYREEFATWENYCKAVLGWSKTQANRLVQGAEVAEDLTPIGVKMPERESHFRELAKLSSKELRQHAWQSVIDENPEGITAKLVRKSVVKVQKDAGLLPERRKSNQTTKTDPTVGEMGACDVVAKAAGDASRSVLKDADAPTGPGEAFELANGTQSKTIIWSSDLFEREFVEGKLRAMKENNQAASANTREDDEEIARRQSFLLGLVEKTNLMMSGSLGEIEKGSLYWAAYEFQHLTASMRPVTAQASSIVPSDEEEQQGG